MAELLVVIAIGALVVTVATPAFMEVYVRARYEAAVNLLAGEIREARSRAIATGWEYRVLGYDNDAGGGRANQFRVFGRRSPAVAWPGEEDPDVDSATQFAGTWTDLPGRFAGVTLDSTNPQFVVTFDSRGSAPTAAALFNPLQVSDAEGRLSTINVSFVGALQVQ